MEDDLFTGGNQPTVDPNKNYLEDLVGEGKKFKTAEELARGKYEADLFVEHMKQSMDELRADFLKVQEENQSRARLEELIASLKQNKDDDHTERQPDTTTKPQSTENIDELVSTKIQQFELQKKQNDNFNSVKNKLKERYGENYSNVLKEHIEELGLTPAFVNDLARNHPSVLYKTLGLDVQQPRETLRTPPTTRQSQFAPKVEKRTWSYYQKLRREQPSVYWDGKTQAQLHRDRVELGDEFKDGSWSEE